MKFGKALRVVKRVQSRVGHHPIDKGLEIFYAEEDMIWIPDCGVPYIGEIDAFYTGRTVGCNVVFSYSCQLSSLIDARV